MDLEIEYIYIYIHAHIGSATFRATSSVNNFPRIWFGRVLDGRKAERGYYYIHVPIWIWKRKESGKNGALSCPPPPAAKTGSRFVIAAWIIFCTTAREIRSPTSHPGSERSRQVSSHDTRGRGREGYIYILLFVLLSSFLLPPFIDSLSLFNLSC